jgi:ribosomal protein S18 acetylase RimI-like enzyme
MSEPAIAPAAGAADFAAVRGMLLEYAREFGGSPCFEGIDLEADTLPGAYGPPHGRLLVARRGGEVVGCVAVRRLGDGVCEMKRLYVRPGLRGGGLGQRLIEAALAAGHDLGYRMVRLDTLERMTAARALYIRLGFAVIPAYYPNPAPGVVCLEKRLAGEAAA